jgi:Asp-tRNA(Asn)/Glu-tRNA(Gln) amidotransferase A subunit family amidase
MATNGEYRPEEVKSPRLAGARLRLFVGLLESPVIGSVLQRVMMKQAGVLRIREHPAGEPPWAGEGLDPADPPSGESIDLAALAELPAGAPEGASYPFETTADFRRAYREGAIGPAEVAERAEAAVRASESREPPLRAVIFQDEAEVRRLGEALGAGGEGSLTDGVLAGVPVAVKDEMDQRGYPTTVGTGFICPDPAEEDATVVARIRRAGALLIGRANMHEIGIGVTGVNPHYGTARNPYDPTRVCGGSSSGPAAAVAAGLCPIALGADGGGSIRIPAAFCGVVGLKPTFSRLSEHGAFTLCWSVAHVGPIGASAADVALAYMVMAGPDERDPVTLRQPPPSLAKFDDRDLSDLTLGIYPAWFEHADPEVVTACRRSLDGFAALGATIREVRIPELNLVRPVHLVTIAGEMAAAQMQRYEEHRKHYGYDVRVNLALARAIPAADYLHAQRLRTRIVKQVLEAMRGIDALVTPTTGCTAPPVPRDALRTGDSDLALLEKIMRFATLANLTGQPAISFPAGYDDQGLPVGLQAIGHPWREDVLLRLARASESFTPRRPPVIRYRFLEQG